MTCEGVSLKDCQEIWRAWESYDYKTWKNAVDTRINGGSEAHSWNDIILLAANAIGNEPEV